MSDWFKQLFDVLGRSDVVGSNKTSSNRPTAASNVLFRGPKFVEACEYWLTHVNYVSAFFCCVFPSGQSVLIPFVASAIQLNDVALADRIHLLVGRDSSSSTDSASSSREKDHSIPDATQISLVPPKLKVLDSDLCEQRRSHIASLIRPTQVPPAEAHLPDPNLADAARELPLSIKTIKPVTENLLQGHRNQVSEEGTAIAPKNRTTQSGRSEFISEKSNT